MAAEGRSFPGLKSFLGSWKLCSAVVFTSGDDQFSLHQDQLSGTQSLFLILGFFI